ncbi:hypothetical protein [Halocalculus aciditolerans]|uniref:hypothetical protein n=1 Tax=Halocalculus aciditolerans TaxID=1383812 RepID=UPI001666FA08|nr:hypothetical protein [Halocalculus aciditolerans]
MTRFKQAEYTGENRCTPCTVINVLISIFLSLVIGFFSQIIGGVAFILFLAAIYFRGYLIPGTPKLTKKYLPVFVLRAFGKEIESPPTGLESNSDPAQNQSSNNAIDNPEQFFYRHNVVAPCDSSDDLCLTESFSSVWKDEIRALPDCTAHDAAIAFQLSDSNLRLIETNSGVALKNEKGSIGEWPSRSAFEVDIAAAKALDGFVPDWWSRTGDERGWLLSSLRLFTPICPHENGPASMEEDMIETCCSTQDRLKVVCEQNNEVLFEHRL